MPIQKEMLDMSVRIVGDIPDKRRLTGRRRGTIGTGFMASVPSQKFVDVQYPYVFTAHHVIDAQPKIEVQVANPFSPGELYPPFPLWDWRQPLEGVDLVVCPLRDEDGPDQYVQGFRMEGAALPPDRVPALGSPMLYIGYLEPLNRMMVRAGTIGALEQKGVRHSQPEYDYECHLVDCRSYGGFSGSPCFVTQTHPILEELDKGKIVGVLPDGFPPVGSLAHVTVLCGMFTEHLDDTVPNPDGVVSRYGVGVMLPSREIWRALMTKKMQDERREWDEQRKQADDDSEPKLRMASATDGEDEFSRFERLTRRLVNTPKPGKTDAQ